MKKSRDSESRIISILKETDSMTYTVIRRPELMRVFTLATGVFDGIGR